MPKDCCTEIGYYFGIGPIEEIVRECRDKFINNYVVSDNNASVSCYTVNVKCQHFFDRYLMYLYCLFLFSCYHMVK